MFNTFGGDNSSATRGLNMALGVLSDTLMKNKELGIADMLLGILFDNCMPKQNSETDDADSRKQAVKSLAQVALNIGLVNFDEKNIQKLFNTLYKSMQDYTLDRRGDVGSWVREEAMRSLTIIIQNCANKKIHAQFEKELGPEAEFYERYINALMQQLVEKIDRVREVAGRSL